ncbi:hypothetical protein [Enemella sp. A6]|uniref:hypothetical protein n=1 Tax=Enemella sp. A6 TaxID=3440152 RepID=UPI003EBB9773
MLIVLPIDTDVDTALIEKVRTACAAALADPTLGVDAELSVRAGVLPERREIGARFEFAGLAPGADSAEATLQAEAGENSESGGAEPGAPSAAPDPLLDPSVVLAHMGPLLAVEDYVTDHDLTPVTSSAARQVAVLGPQPGFPEGTTGPVAFDIVIDVVV